MTRFVARIAPPSGVRAAVLAATLTLSCATGCSTYGVRNPSGSGVSVVRPDEATAIAGTGVESQDLVAVTDKMARSILATPQIQNFNGTPRIVLLPVENETRFALNKDIFLSRIRGQLNTKARGKVLFLARERMEALEKERELKRTGQVVGTENATANEFRGADFFLTGKLQSLTTKTSKGVSDYVLYSFQLLDPRTSDILWEDQAEVKKVGLDDAAYR
jgi:PBP1b-binding outer membrane lipoprotein LpoB